MALRAVEAAELAAERHEDSEYTRGEKCILDPMYAGAEVVIEDALCRFDRH